VSNKVSVGDLIVFHSDVAEVILVGEDGEIVAVHHNLQTGESYETVIDPWDYSKIYKVEQLSNLKEE
jgi:hypothetical protein